MSAPETEQRGWRPHEKTKVAVVGAGAFGRHHARVFSSLPNAELVAIVDVDVARAEALAAEFGCRPLIDYRSLAGEVTAAVVAVPTEQHARVGVELLNAGIHVLVEKPIAPDLNSADVLIDAARKNRCILQIGHLEQFNPVVEAVHALASLPLFFEVHRMSPFAPRSLDVDVILDLMIHDIEIVLSLVNSPIERLEATGIPILSSKADIGSVRLIFQNGCVANLTASRVSADRIRKLRFFQPRQYVSVDYSTQEGAVFGLDADNQIIHRPLEIQTAEPLVRQAKAFLETVKSRNLPRVPGEAGRNALEVALRIVEEMERHSRIVAKTIAADRW